MHKAESNQVRYELNKTSYYSPWMYIVTMIILLTFLVVGSIGYFLLLNKVFGEVTFSLGTFLVTSLIVYLVSVFLHEMGHLLMAKRYGYPFRIFKAGGILAFHNSFRNISVKPSQFLTGGFVLLNYNEAITSNNKLSQFVKNDFRYIALGGMVSNGLLVIIGYLCLFHTKTFEFGFLLICFNMMILIAQFLHPSDLTRYWFIHKNPKFAAIVFTEELSINRKVNGFLEGLFQSYIEESLSNRMFDQHTFAVIQRMIEYNLIHDKESSRELNQFIRWFRENFNQILPLGFGIRISAQRLMNMLIEYNLIDPKDISMRNISPVIHKHPFHSYYSHFSSYKQKIVELETIKKERGTNGLPF
ncbi:site-2 protease family protein [Neobacillus niacini]|uniref:site-2 protease family protein n=1 Tax=Neobacillus niacini TaxID=86668 RepID=UPI0007AB4231|nr:site-2 protease family protein [Neobacillus niacini]MEC1522113.1 site-2 protease family protein [Neobacillus niacini]